MKRTTIAAVMLLAPLTAAAEQECRQNAYGARWCRPAHAWALCERREGIDQQLACIDDVIEDFDEARARFIVRDRGEHAGRIWDHAVGLVGDRGVKKARLCAAKLSAWVRNGRGDPPRC